MSARSTVYRCLLACCVVLQTLAPTTASADPVFGRLKRLVFETTYHGQPPHSHGVTAIEELAKNIDWLEHHIDTYGSIVAKQPDIWGEARLTKHRDEYEQMLYRELNGFRFRINASISQADSMFLAQAVALSNASEGSTTNQEQGLDTKPSGTGPTVAVANAQLRGADDLSTSFKSFGIADEADPETGIGLEPVLHLDQLSRYLQHLHELRRINEGDDTSDSPGYALNLVRIPVSVLPGKMTRTGFGAEITVTAKPVLSDDLLPTTFRNLVVNDLVDLAGLPLVRLTEYLNTPDGQHFLKARERNRKSQQLLDEARATRLRAFELFGESRPEDIARAIRRDVERLLLDDLCRKALLAAGDELLAEAERTSLQTFNAPMTPPVLSKQMYGTTASRNLEEAYKLAVRADASPSDEKLSRVRSQMRRIVEANADLMSGQAIGGLSELWQAVTALDISIANGTLDQQSMDAAVEIIARLPGDTLGDVTLSAMSALRQVNTDACRSSTISPTSRSRRAVNPINPSTLVETLGLEGFVTVSTDFFNPSYNGRYVRWNGGVSVCTRTDGCCNPNCTGVDGRIGLLDARRFLEAEFIAAYQLLSRPEIVRTLAALASPDSGLATAIRMQIVEAPGRPGQPSVEQYRNLFYSRVHAAFAGGAEATYSADACYPGDPSMVKHEAATVEPDSPENAVEALAWMAVVESALLNERLNEDIDKLATAKGIPDLNLGRMLHFYLPDTVTQPGAGLEDLRGEFEEATQIFQRYVEERWPIHVFAIDPREQDQNVADVSKRKRELQFAMALGFINGQIGGNTLTQYAREVETQVETISLNRTVVGFGHGDNTFGWRFQPRVQALPVPGTLGAIRESLCGTPRDYDLRHRQLEPGKRECVALVLMPSFVPYADFDVRTNWYKLTNPKNAALTMKDTMHLSRAITAMQNSRAQCSQCQHLYREGEVTRLMTRIEQLDRELPLQSMRALVPYENTLGGFEMFNTGVTDLSPELIGWYGAPGVNGSDGYACGCYESCGLSGGKCDTEAGCTKLQNEVTALKDKVAALVQEKDKVEFLPPNSACVGAGTSLFLVGDNFSVHDTKVIAGGVCIPHVQLISRELMRVTIPSCVNRVTLCEDGVNRPYVPVYVATPYGVTNHLHIPVWGTNSDTSAPADGGCCPGNPTPAEPDCPEEIPMPTFMRAFPDNGPDGSLRLVRDASWDVEPTRFLLVADEGDATTPAPGSTATDPTPTDPPAPDPVVERLIRIEQMLNDKAVGGELQALTVNVSSPDVVVDTGEDRSHGHNHPLLQQMKTRTQECWRNVRDQLPGY